MFKCWIALGGNLGSVSETFREAAALLQGTPGLSVIRMSRFYTTSPVGVDAGREFLNAAAELQTSLSPLEVLSTLQAVETQLGRQRTVRWGPRTLDLDLLLYDQQTVSLPTLIVPHPHMWYRRFALDPLVEIAPDVLHCGHQLSVAELRDRLLVRPLSCALLGGASDLRADLLRRFETEYSQVKWHVEHSEEAWLTFCLGPVSRWPGGAAANRIDVASFPTTPEQTIRYALAAALDSTRVIG